MRGMMRLMTGLANQANQANQAQLRAAALAGSTGCGARLHPLPHTYFSSFHTLREIHTTSTQLACPVTNLLLEAGVTAAAADHAGAAATRDQHLATKIETETKGGAGAVVN
jgi:hypothetical protein